MNRAMSVFHDRARKRAGIHALYLLAQIGRPRQDVDRQLLVLVFVGRLPPFEAAPVARLRPESTDERDPGSTARNSCRSST